MNNIFASLRINQILKQKTKILQAQVTIQDIIVHKHERGLLSTIICKDRHNSIP